MTRALLSRWQLPLRIGLFGAMTAFAVAACKTVEYVYPKNLQGFALPHDCPSGVAPSNSTGLNACLSGIEFDTAEFIGDEQRLLVYNSGGGLPCFGDPEHTCRYGPRAKVEPVKGAELYSPRAMAEGRIIARMYLRPHEKEGYPKLGLTPGDTTYWWVKSPDTSAFIHRTKGSALESKPSGLTMTPHPRGSFQQAFARWVWKETDETLNVGCQGHCCKP
jgi:hypothetical protein